MINVRLYKDRYSEDICLSSLYLMKGTTMINIAIDIIYIMAMSILLLKYNDENQGILMLKNTWNLNIVKLSGSTHFHSSERNEILDQLNHLSNDFIIKKNKLRPVVLFILITSIIYCSFDLIAYRIHNSLIFIIHTILFKIYIPFFIFSFFYILLSENKFSKSQKKIWENFILQWNQDHPDIKIH